MSPSTSPLVNTYDLAAFWRLPEPRDNAKLELIAGVLYMTPPPDYQHDSLVSRLLHFLTAHLLTTGDKGNLYVPRAALWTGPATYLEPDLFYLSAALEAKLGSNRRNAADLVIEVISPASAVYDRNAKADTYGALGVNELWLVDGTEKAVEVRLQTGQGFGPGTIFTAKQRIGSQIFPGLELTATQLFED